MANTGAPYFIPYVEPTDLVRDYPAADEASADAIAAALDAIPVLAGIGSNVVQTVKTNTFSTSSSAFVDVPGLGVTITPSSASSKVLVVAYVQQSAASSGRGRIRLARDTTDIALASTGSATAGLHSLSTIGGDTISFAISAYTIVFLDEPNTTSATEYKIRMNADIPSVHINRSDNNTMQTISTITAIEVAA